mmetsp:Transcript_4287/g.6077  ORF Transcript_4287/g.6077 Transcript_4287/m.6077 type:complete len:129 (-) Transcript_4287:881-1267(-)
MKRLISFQSVDLLLLLEFQEVEDLRLSSRIAALPRTYSCSSLRISFPCAAARLDQFVKPRLTHTNVNFYMTIGFSVNRALLGFKKLVDINVNCLANILWEVTAYYLYTRGCFFVSVDPDDKRAVVRTR